MRGLADLLKVCVRAVSFWLVVIVLVGGVSYYLYEQNHPTVDSQKVAQEEADKLVVMVGKLMVLPEGERPVIATVSDPSKLINQSFFANAEKGDKVLIFNVARKAVLYRESTNQIIEVAPLNVATPIPTK
jgi:hypothetical protein